MLAEKDLNQIQSYLIQILPQLLRQEPEIATTIEGIIAQQFPSRNEFARLFEEVKLLNENMHRRFEQVERRIELVEERFEQVERRIELVEERFEQMGQRFEQRFEQVEQHLEQMERRFEQVELRIEQTERVIEALREEMNQRFEKVDQRFDKIDQRFEEVDQRFDKIDQRFEKVDQRFEKVDQRFDQQHRDHLELKRRVIKVESTVDRIDKKITSFDAWLKMVTGNLGDEKGQALEQLFALGLNYALKNRDIKPESIQLRQQFIDVEGLVYLKKGKYIEVDIIAENGKFTVFEVKASAVAADVDIFARKVELIQRQNSDKQVLGIFISPGAKDEVKECCKEYNVELLD